MQHGHEHGGARGLEVLSTAGMRAADAFAMRHGMPGITLMEHAGMAVARMAQELLPGGMGRVLVLTGPGNNGGDGWVAARLLQQRGCPVTLAALKPAESLKGDAAEAARRYNGKVADITALPRRGKAAPEHFDLVIDALFGAGLDRPLQGAAAEMAERVNAAREQGHVRVLAVDVPSGLHGDTGQPPQGGPVIVADATITFFRKKPAHLLQPGRTLCGRVAVADIGIPATALDEIAPAAWENAPELWRDALPVLPPDAHKYARGSLMVLSGDALHTGASRLAALAGLRGGAGVVSLAGEREALLVHAAHLTEVMLDEAGNAPAFLDVLRRKRANAAVIGPAAGVSERTRAMTLAALNEMSELPLVLDADVFSAFADAPEELFEAIRQRRGPVVLTPHEGEFARLFPDLASTVARAAGKLERARQAASRAGCIVPLKGPDTVIADAHGHAVIEAHGPAWLATAGAGDVLAGLIGALLAQGMEAFMATAAAAWLHAEAARHAGAGLIASDLIPAIGHLRAKLARGNG